MTEVSFDRNGLIPGVIQDAATGQVLMLGYLNEQSLALTEETGRVHFWSRSRGELWEKGATSGNYLHVVDIAVDCDRDAILITARPDGPTCHTGAAGCFAIARNDQGFGNLERLWDTIQHRIAAPTPDSYTAKLADAGPDLTGRKLVEEATETLLAAKNHASGTGPPGRVVEESADVVYHLLALLAERGISARAVVEELARRAR